VKNDTLVFADRPGHTVNPDGSVTINNLLKSTVAAATNELIEDGIDWTLSVFKDNSGVIALDDDWASASRSRPTTIPAIEPYGGAATGAGGCIRDVLGTGLGAAHRQHRRLLRRPPTPRPTNRCRPAACTRAESCRRRRGRARLRQPHGHPHRQRRGLLRRSLRRQSTRLLRLHRPHPARSIQGKARPGDRIIALGGRTGRDGIHGATFSSAELEHTAADEFSHAVQIGNAIEEKRVLDAILRARDEDPPARSTTR
jgi:hypothetical protein